MYQPGLKRILASKQDGHKIHTTCATGRVLANIYKLLNYCSAKNKSIRGQHNAKKLENYTDMEKKGKQKYGGNNKCSTSQIKITLCN
jgi:hypothetical protein